MRRKTHREIVRGWHPFTKEEINRYVSKGFWHNQSVCDLLERNVERTPNKKALVDDTCEVTWRELQERTDRLALHLKRLGIGYGDFFVLQLPNVVDFFYLYFALNRIGAIPIMSLPRHRRVEVNHAVGLHEAKGIAVPLGDKFDYMTMVEEIKNQHSHLKLTLGIGDKAPPEWLSLDELMKEEIIKEYPGDYLQQFKPDPNDICTEQLSGGTTGLPKGIPRTHNDYVCIWDYYSRTAGLTDESVTLTSTPVEHNASFHLLNGPMIWRGGTMVLTKSPRPERHFELIEKYKITHTFLVPVQITYWLEAKELKERYDLSTLKVITSGGQKVRAEIVSKSMKEFGVNFINLFGMSEGPTCGTRWDSPYEAQLNTVGMPPIIDPEVEIKLVNDEGEEVKRGEIGEMIMKGPLTFKGYFRNPEENDRCFDKNGFFHTGDLMSQREDGRYVVEGRKKDMIIRGGENVYCEPIEELLIKHPKIVNSAVVGMPDAKLGERLCAFVQPIAEEALTFEDIKKWIGEQGVAVFQYPERVEIVSGWPLIGMSKINKRFLRLYITHRLFEEGHINKELANEYIKRDGFIIDDVLSGKVKIEFTRMA